MEATNTVTSTPTTTTVVTTTRVAKTRTPAKLGRKPINITETSDGKFSIVDLEKLNPTVKSPTIRAFVARNVSTGRYVVDSTLKTGGRGKPANIYRLA